MPEATWGDTIRQHKITGEPVQIDDFSQLFTFRFAKPVPLDSTVKEFLKLPEVEYVNQVEQFQDEWNYGSFVDVAAPGEDILTTLYGGRIY